MDGCTCSLCLLYLWLRHALSRATTSTFKRFDQAEQDLWEGPLSLKTTLLGSTFLRNPQLAEALPSARSGCGAAVVAGTLLAAWRHRDRWRKFSKLGDFHGLAAGLIRLGDVGSPTNNRTIDFLMTRTQNASRWWAALAAVV